MQYAEDDGKLIEESRVLPPEMHLRKVLSRLRTFAEAAKDQHAGGHVELSAVLVRVIGHDRHHAIDSTTLMRVRSGHAGQSSGCVLSCQMKR